MNKTTGGSPGWKIVKWISRLILAAVFLAAAVPKIIDPQEFALSVFRYQLAPYELVNAIAVLLPWVELIMAAVLLLPCIKADWRAGAEGVLLVLLAGFTVAIGINIYRGVDIACGCFSVNPDVGIIGGLSIIRNAALMLITLGLLICDMLSVNRKIAEKRNASAVSGR